MRIATRQQLVLTSSVLAVLAVAFLDYLTGDTIALSFFYMVPVIAVTRMSGRTLGIVLAGVCAGLFPLADALSGHTVEPWTAFWNFSVRAATLVTVAILVGRLDDALRHERDLARTDPLTGAANPRAFRELAEREFDRVARQGTPLTLAFVDMDNFKTVNDEFGHDKGDELLMVIAEFLRRSTRAVDTVGRLGGDEFSILMPDTGYSGACVTMGRIRHGVEEELEHARMPEATSFSIGIVTVDTRPESLDVLLLIADQLMYAAKRAGKNQVKGRDLTGRSPDPIRSDGTGNPDGVLSLSEDAVIEKPPDRGTELGSRR